MRARQQVRPDPHGDGGPAGDRRMSSSTSIERAEFRVLLADAEKRYLDLVTHCDQAILVVRDGNVAIANDAAVGLLGAARVEQVTRQPIAAFLALPSGDSRSDRDKPVEVKLSRLDGASIPVRLDILPCRQDGGDAVQILLRDVGERKRLEGRLQFLMRHDILTELPTGRSSAIDCSAQSPARSAARARSR